MKKNCSRCEGRKEKRRKKIEVKKKIGFSSVCVVLLQKKFCLKNLTK
jgi:hypothetical protein